MAMLQPGVGIAVIVVGLLFLLLSLISAFRDVFPRQETVEQLRRTPDARSYAELLATVNTVKTWLALAVVGTVLVFAGGFVATGGAGTVGTLLGMQGPAVDRAPR